MNPRQGAELDLTMKLYYQQKMMVLFILKILLVIDIHQHQHQKNQRKPEGGNIKRWRMLIKLLEQGKIHME
jgi:hypothetical protein